MEQVLDSIRDFADNAHGSQMRKYTPEKYIVHPVRVMETTRKYDASLPVLAAALLHDVLEDTAVSRHDLMQFLLTVMDDQEAQETLSLVVELTDVYVKSAFPQFNRRHRKQKEIERIIGTSPKAQTIKYADILDNVQEITIQDPDFAPRYLRESLAILKAADKGNPELYEIVTSEVKAILARLGRKGY